MIKTKQQKNDDRQKRLTTYKIERSNLIEDTFWVVQYDPCGKYSGPVILSGDTIIAEFYETNDRLIESFLYAVKLVKEHNEKINLDDKIIVNNKLQEIMDINPEPNPST